MTLKYQLDSLDGLDDNMRGMYAEKDGKFVLAIDGLPQPEDTSGLKAKVDELLAEKKAEKKRREEAEEAARQAAEESARKNGDVEALESSWKQKLAEREAELSNSLSQRDAMLQDLTVNATAAGIANEIAMPGTSKVLLPHITSRLRMEYREGRPVTVVLDAQGKPSALTVDELKKEIANDPAFAPLIVGSQASGGGAGGAKGGGAAKQWHEMSGMERVELRRKDPALHARLKAAAGAPKR